jgi:hypothetical protein
VTRFGILQFCLTVAILAPSVGVSVCGQDLGSPYVPPPTGDTSEVDPSLAPLPADPATDGVPAGPSTWTYQRTVQNRAGTTVNSHQWTGSDPYNYTREHQVQLRDGRTLSQTQTRSWDGTTGSMERTIVGPNGQTHQFQHAWTPDDPTAATAEGQPALAIPPSGGTPVEPPKKLSWAEKLNPFRKGGLFRPSKPAGPRTSVEPRRSGFTLGSGKHSGWGHLPSGLSKNHPGEPTPSLNRPSSPGSNRSAQGLSHGRNL